MYQKLSMRKLKGYNFLKTTKKYNFQAVLDKITGELINELFNLLFWITKFSLYGIAKNPNVKRKDMCKF